MNAETQSPVSQDTEALFAAIQERATTPQPPQRFAWMEVDLRLFVDLCQQINQKAPSQWTEIVENALPADAAIWRVEGTFHPSVVRILLHSESFAEVPDRGEIPTLPPAVFRRLSWSPVVIEEHTETGVVWGVGLTGPNPTADQFIECRDEAHAFAVKEALALIPVPGQKRG